MMIKYLEWDSIFFEKKIGEVFLSELDNIEHLEKDFDLIYVKSATNFNIDIKDYILTYEEVKVIFSKKISDVSKVNANIYAIADTFNNIDKLYELAYESGKYSRFKLDTKFSEMSFKTLYQMWINNSLKKTFADEVLVYSVNNQIIGFVTYKIVVNKAIIGLIATDSNEQGKGIGTQLIHEVERRVQLKKVLDISIPTQLKNKLACKFYNKLGFNITEQTTIKHYWKL